MRKKIYSLICAGFIMTMAAMQVQAAEIKNIAGFSIEPRGSIIDTATTRISNLGKGDIGIIIETLAHVECDKIKNIAVLQREEDGKWTEVARYTYDAKKEDFPTEDLSGMTNEFTVKNQKTGYKYRVVGVHYVEANGKGQSFMTKTGGVMITEYGD